MFKVTNCDLKEKSISNSTLNPGRRNESLLRQRFAQFMTQLKVSLPEPLGEFVVEQAAKSGKRSPDDYVASLVDEARRREIRKEIESKLIEGLESGEPTPMTESDWAEIREQVHANSKRNRG
jgi:antitoxin ParD1/3/4